MTTAPCEYSILNFISKIKPYFKNQTLFQKVKLISKRKAYFKNQTLFSFVYKIDKFLFLFYFTSLIFTYLKQFKYILFNKSSIFIPESFGIILLKYKQDKSL